MVEKISTVLLNPMFINKKRNIKKFNNSTSSDNQNKNNEKPA